MTANGEPVALVLESVSFEAVEFVALLPDGAERPVSVRVASGHGWLKACRFPHGQSDAGASLGDDQEDAAVRRRAAEELVRLEAAARVTEGRLSA